MVRLLSKLVLATGTVTALLMASQYSAAAASVSPHSRAAPATSCSPGANGDDVHISSSGPPTASGHGWWTRGNCTAAKAQVSIVLEEYLNGGWRERGQGGQGSYVPGPGSGKRATARAVCLNTHRMSWRSQVSVSVEGESGTASHTTPSVPVDCMVP